MRYIPALDGLRAYAVALVLLAHMPVVRDSALSAAAAKLFSGLHLGYLGVDIFFVLSGFLVTSILLADKNEGRYSFSRFYLKRSLRLFPAFYLCVAVSAATMEIPWREVLANLLYLSNYYYAFNHAPSPLRHTWSLAVEEQFYLAWPIVIALLSARKLGTFLLIGIPSIVVASLLISIVLVPEDVFSRFVLRGTMFRILSLGAGALMALYVARLGSIRASHIAMMAALGFSGHIIALFLELHSRAILGLVSMSLLSVSVFLAVFVGVSKGTSAIANLLENAPTVYLGKISYGIYLYHYPILYALGGRHSEVSPGTLIAFIVLSVAAAALSYRLIERPILDYKDRLNRRPSTPAE